MAEIDVFGEYVKRRLDRWGDEFSLARDCDYLGHQSRNMLQVLIEHKGEMPGKSTGYKPLEVNLEALQIEKIISDMAIHGQRAVACVLRGYYCGSGRRKFERWETANLLMTNAGCPMVPQRQYLTMHAIGVAHVRGALMASAGAYGLNSAA